MENDSSKQTEIKQRESERTNVKQIEEKRIETEQDGMKVILEFPKRADKCEEAAMQEIRTLLVDMLREHCRRHSSKGAEPL